MTKKPNDTISMALIEADAAIVVLASALGNRLSAPEQGLIDKAREKLAIAEGRVDDLRGLASRLAEGI